jgi:uncharacterized protein (TIGR03118 family)
MIIHRSAWIVAAIVGCSACSSANESSPTVGSVTSPELRDPTASEAMKPPASGLPSPSTRIVQNVVRTDLVSDLSGHGILNSTLHNAWGLAFDPVNGIGWIAVNGSGQAIAYDVSGVQPFRAAALTIPTPAGSGEPSAPTGIVFNHSTVSFGGDRFISVTEDGTAYGWTPGESGATLRVDNAASGAIYKGVTIAMGHRAPMLYAANFHAGTVDVFDETYRAVQAPGGFRDSSIPDGYAPFNVQGVGGVVLVTFAKQDADKRDDVKGPGNGFLRLFDAYGHLRARLISGEALNSPWGVALAPPRFSHAGWRLLVGNFGDGTIRVYGLAQSAMAMEPGSLERVKSEWFAAPTMGTTSGSLDPVVIDGPVHKANPGPDGNASFAARPLVEYEGMLGDAHGAPLVIAGLWAIRFSPKTDALYFTAGPNDEQDGIFGRLTLP